MAAALVGCREEESISSYEAERAEPKAEVVDVERVRNGLDHMFVAIVAQDDTAWFFKLVARGDAIEALRKPFEEFIASVELGEKGAKPAWKLPEGWVEKAGNKMRIATIEVPSGDKKLELAVSTLPYSGDWDKFLTVNVNRWLDQLQQGELSGKTIEGLSKSLPIKGGEATFVELVGVMSATPGMMPAGHPPVAEGAKPQAAGGAAARPMQAPMGGAVMPAEEFAKPAEFTYQPPAGWQPGQTTMMRKAAFVVSEEGQQASVTVTQFSASGAMSDPTAQAQRWAGEAGLQLSEAELKSAAKEVTIDGTAGQLFELLGPEEGDAPRGVLAAMVRRGDQMWFFKMGGDRALVAKQGEAFEKFIESVRFSEKAS